MIKMITGIGHSRSRRLERYYFSQNEFFLDYPSAHKIGDSVNVIMAGTNDENMVCYINLNKKGA